MRQNYQLAPIPPFRGAGGEGSSLGSKIPNSSSTSTCSSTLSSGLSHSESSSSIALTVEDDDDTEMAPPPGLIAPPSPRVVVESPPLTSFHTTNTKRRPFALAKLRLTPSKTYTADPEGASARPPPSPLVHQQILNDHNVTSSPLGSPQLPPHFSKPHPVQSIRASLIPLRFQPKRVVASKPTGLGTIKGTPLTDENDASVVGQTRPPSRPTATHAISSYPFPAVGLTPPPTPNTRKSAGGPKTKKSSEENIVDPRLPLTPSTSPTLATTLKPQATGPSMTVSAKALASHRLHKGFASKYSLGDELGSGGFGFVVQATRRSDGLLCAVKFIYKDKVPHHAWVKDELWGDGDDANGVMRTKDGIKRVPLEAYVLKTIRHRGVVAFVELYEDKNYLYLVMEHHGSPWTAPEKEVKAMTSPCRLSSNVEPLSTSSLSKKVPMQPYVNGTRETTSPAPMNISPPVPALRVPSPPPAMMRRASCDLFECIEQHSRLPEQYAKYVFAQLIDVVGCLHYNGFVHRDLKDENIVIDDKYRVKLIDFGSTYLFDYRQETQNLSRFFGTLNFAAPEILKKGAYSPMAAEIWSLGILLTILVTGESLFRDAEAIKAYRASPPAHKISETCMDLIFRCLAFNPKDRWNCFKIRTHPWLADCQWPWTEVPVDACTKSVNRVRK